jgi:hypothetical protein
LARIAQGTVCKILADQAVKPHKVRYYLECRDPEFDTEMAEVLCVYQEVAILRAAQADAAKACPEADSKATDKTAPNVAFVSYDEKPGIQAISKRRRTCHRSRASMRASRATMNTSATGR